MVTEKKEGVAIFLSDEADFKCKLIRRDNEGHFVLIKGAIHHEQRAITNLMCPVSVHPTSLNIYWTSKHKRVVVGNFNTPLSPIDRSSRPKKNQQSPIL
jgi:hypothetical protein